MIALALCCGGLIGAAPATTTSTTQLEVEKLRLEVNKLQKEVDDFDVSNWPMGKGTVATMAAIGGAFGTLFGLIMSVVLFFAARTLNKTTEDKTEQERRKALFSGLGAERDGERIGAISVLLQRVEEIGPDHPTAANERAMIVRALVASTKVEGVEPIQKYIADGIARVLGVLPSDGAPPRSLSLEKSAFDKDKVDFQRARLKNAFWRGIDARGADFYDAVLDHVSFREGRLQGAVFMKASLQHSVFRNADLRDARLEGADLTGADFTGAKLFRANLTGARIDATTCFDDCGHDAGTKWPAEFTPPPKTQSPKPS